MADGAWLDSDIGEIARTTQFGVERWTDAHEFVGRHFEPEDRDVVWLLIVVGAPRLHQSPLGLAHAVYQVKRTMPEDDGPSRVG